MANPLSVCGNGGATIISGITNNGTSTKVVWQERTGNAAYTSLFGTQGGAPTLPPGYSLPSGHSIIATELYTGISPWNFSAQLMGGPGSNHLVRLFGLRATLGAARHATIRRFRSDRRGATAVIVAIALTSLIGAVGLAIDGARLVMAQSRLRAALDAAALIAARDMTTVSRQTNIQNATNLFWANFSRTSATSTIGVPGHQHRRR